MFRRAFIATIAIISIALPASGADFIDEQIGRTPLPTQEAGWAGAFVDDSTASVFPSMMYAGPIDVVKNGRGVYCASFSDPKCQSQDRFTYNAYLPKCQTTYATLDVDCIKSLFAISSDGKEVEGQFVRYFPETTNTVFTGDSKAGIASGWNPSIWKFSGINHPGGDEFLVVPSIISFQGFINNPGHHPQLFVNIYAISRKPSTQSATLPINVAGAVNGLEMTGNQVNSFECPLMLGNKECAIAWPLPNNVKFKISITTSSVLSGWMHGRLSEPTIEAVKLPGRTGTDLVIEAGAVKVPIFSIWKRYESLPQSMKDILTQNKGQKGRIQFPAQWRSVYDGSGVEPYDKISADHDLDNHTEANFNEFLGWLALSENKSIAEKTQWAFYTSHVYTNDDPNGKIRVCSELNPNVSGVVTTNATQYLANPPKFNPATNSLDYQVSSPHFSRTGQDNVGTYDLVIDGNVARCIYGFTAAPMQASVSIINANGEQKVATSVLTEKNGWVKLSVKGFTYSSPVLRVKFTQFSEKKPDLTPSPKPSASKVPAKSVITCIKGKTVKKVTGSNPKCPTGYKKK